VAAKPELESTTDQELPALKNGEMAQILTISVIEKKTRPPARYTEGALIEDMKNAGKHLEEGDAAFKAILKQVNGLGTAATRDSIIETLKSHKYIELQAKNIVPTQKGEALIAWLEKYCEDLCNVALTARWEAELDVVATRGGGPQFEKAIETKVQELVAILKNAQPIEGRGAAPKESSMSESGERRANKPTPKMVEYARNIATKMKTKLPPEVADNFDACRAFIDQNKEHAMFPSEKQLKFANSIAERKGAQIPEEALKNGKLLSQWIDENK
jgi:DNA topoisomerase III